MFGANVLKVLCFFPIECTSKLGSTDHVNVFLTFWYTNVARIFWQGMEIRSLDINIILNILCYVIMLDLTSVWVIQPFLMSPWGPGNGPFHVMLMWRKEVSSSPLGFLLFPLALFCHFYSPFLFKICIDQNAWFSYVFPFFKRSIWRVWSFENLSSIKNLNTQHSKLFGCRICQRGGRWDFRFSCCIFRFAYFHLVFVNWIRAGFWELVSNVVLGFPVWFPFFFDLSANSLRLR